MPVAVSTPVAAEDQATKAALVPNAVAAETFVKDLADTATHTVGQAKVSDEERVRRFREVFTKSFDAPWIGQFVLGRYWRKATPPQREEFLKLFEDISVLTWSMRFKDYANQYLTVTGVRAGSNDETLVDAVISQPQGQGPISLTWRLHRSDQGYRVADLSVEGVSMAITYRSEYSAVIQRAGGQVEGLLKALRSKVSDLTQVVPGSSGIQSAAGTATQ